jgi:DNA polymerase-3 subunit delta'
LLYGSAGAGQDSVANALAQGWLCANPTTQGACGSCQSCGAFSRNANPDFQRVEPHGAGNQIKLAAIVPAKEPPKDALPTVPISIFSRTGPLLSRHKVVVFQEAEKMNLAAANAFLKTLEEPVPYMKFILVTSEIGRILPTIRSRCVAASCELPTENEARVRLGELTDIFVVVPHLVERFREDRAPFDRMVGFVDVLTTVSSGSALRLADEFRNLCGDMGDEDDRERQSIAQGLELLATLIAKRHPAHPEWIHAALEAHRRVLGNVNARAVLDALFVRMLNP